LVWRIEKRDRVKLFVWGYEMKLVVFIGKKIEFLFFLFFFIFFEFFWIFLNFSGFETDRTGKVGRVGRVRFPGFPGRVGHGLWRVGRVRTCLKRIRSSTDFFCRARARPAGSNGSRVWRVWTRIGSERITTTGRVWPGRVFLKH
jgi:hypothetical protein